MTSSLKRLVVTRSDINQAVVWVTLNNPTKKNALDEQMQIELIDLLRNIKDDASVRCVLLRGAERVFCSGGDISGFEAMDASRGHWYAKERGEVIQSLVTGLGKPVIAAVDGWCLAGGTELALMCDFVYSTEQAKFGLTEIRIGLLPGWGGLTRLPKVVGQRRAKEMIYRGEVVDAFEASRIGLVNRVFETEKDLFEYAEKAAVEIAQWSVPAIKVASDVITQSAHVDDSLSMSLERGALVYLFSTPEAKEGVAAFIEKRKPNFHTRSPKSNQI